MSDTNALLSLPLFPLGAVLFPGGLMPLQIFEVRYLDMISRCHKAGAPFGIVSLRKGKEVRKAGSDAEQFSTIGTLARIEQLERPQPGLMVIRCVGLQRFHIQRCEQLKHGLWIGDVQRIEEDRSVPVPEDLQPAARALQQLLDTLRERGHDEDMLPLQPPLRLDDCGWLANRWCELLPLPLQLKQQLMELDNPLVRLELVADFLNRAQIAG